MRPDFKYYRFYKTGRGNIVGRPVNPCSLYPMWPGFKVLNEPFFEFEEWADTMTFYVTDGISPGIYDRSDIRLLEWLVDPEAEEEYFPDSEIPVQRYKNDDGDECFLLYTPVEMERPQRMIMQINFN